MTSARRAAKDSCGGDKRAALYAPPLSDLYQSVLTLKSAVVSTGNVTMALWRDAIQNERFRPAAENLAHYLALRHHDLSDLQPALSAYGLSSLGRSEARVLTSLDALLATLGRLAGVATPEYPPPLLVSDGERALREEQDRVLGHDPADARTRIMVTLPSQAASDRDLVRRLLAAGTNCVRINCAHDDPTVWADMIRCVQSVAKELARDCPVMMDIAGPKCRIETVQASEKIPLHRGDTFVLAKNLDDIAVAVEIGATITFPEVLDRMKVGDEVWINDGKIGARVVSNEPGRVKLEVFNVRAKGARLKREKGINFPNTELLLPPLTKDDWLALDFVAEHADIIGFSFVHRPSDVVLLDRELRSRRPDRPLQPIVLKIETRAAIEKLPQLIVQSAGRRPLAVMIARGDLAVEVGFGRLSEIQEEILWLCDAAHIPVIWATQVLDNFVTDGVPTRAEATDAAMSQRAECVMLNKGPYLVDAVTFLKDILRRMDRHQSKKSARLGPLQSWRDLAISTASRINTAGEMPACAQPLPNLGAAENVK
jgi:pyruvate kinase